MAPWQWGIWKPGCGTPPSLPSATCDSATNFPPVDYDRIGVPGSYNSLHVSLHVSPLALGYDDTDND